MLFACALRVCVCLRLGHFLSFRWELCIFCLLILFSFYTFAKKQQKQQPNGSLNPTIMYIALDDVSWNTPEIGLGMNIWGFYAHLNCIRSIHVRSVDMCD